MAARVMPGGADFGYAVKSVEPVWRPRPLFNGRVVFMTQAQDGLTRIAQADWGYIRSSPSSLQPGADLPDTGGAKLLYGPEKLADGLDLSAGCPGPCPGGSVLFSARPVRSGPGGYGLFLCPDDWSGGGPIPEPLFDDPDFEDAEPVAVYARDVEQAAGTRPASVPATYARPDRLRLSDGRDYAGSIGFLENLAVMDAIRSPIPWHSLSSDRIDPRKNPLIPPPTGIRTVAVYASYRDRFDDPNRPRIPGDWMKLITVPVDAEGSLRSWVPADTRVPTVLAGLDVDGKVVKWSGQAKDSVGRPGTYYAIAGDHYSPIRSDGYHYCAGCHSGHTFTSIDVRERGK
jgi:hypothetical protein